MSVLTKEQYEQLPDFLKDDYKEVGENEYKHAGLLKVKSTADELNGQLEQERKEREALSSRLSEFEKGQEEKIEKARKEALEQARSKGDVEAVEKRYQEQMTDLEKRVREEERNNVLSEVKQERAQEKSNSIAAQIANQEAADNDSAQALEMLIKSRIQYDPDSGKEIFLDENGSATSLDRKGFIAELAKTPMYKRLLKSGVVTNGGGSANGSNSSSAARKPLKEMTDAERLQFKQEDPIGFKNALRGK